MTADRTARIKELRLKDVDPDTLIKAAYRLGVAPIDELRLMTGPELIEKVVDYEIMSGDRIDDFLPTAAHTSTAKSTGTEAHKATDTPDDIQPVLHDTSKDPRWKRIWRGDNLRRDADRPKKEQ